MQYNHVGGVPSGCILPWYGEAEIIPAGWVLCDGNNGTPDLRGRVIVGVDASDVDFDTVGKTGGHKELQSHSHSCGLYALANGTGRALGTSGSAQGSASVGSTGNGDSGNLQPYHCLHYIMKV
jgi:microcystin-dependent protein